MTDRPTDAGPSGRALSIRLLRAGDLIEVARACFPDHKPEDICERLRGELKAQDEGVAWTLVAEAGGEICGTLHAARHRRQAWLHNCAVRADRRGSGVAGRLLAEAERRCRDAGFERMALHVRRENRSARRAYEKAGFRFVATDGMRGDQLRYQRDLGVRTNDE